MKWKTKYHEMDSKSKEIVNNYKKSSKCYIFGAGIIGREVVKALKHFECFEGYIDNDSKKIAEGYLGEKVYSFDEYLSLKGKGTIIIAVSEANRKIVRDQLEKSGEKYLVDFYFYDEFLNYYFPIICAYYYKKVFINLTQISLTERCTLKCRKCAHACYMVNNSAEDMKLEEAKKTMDSFFSKVDFIQEFVLIGGEPLLYKELAEVIEYLGNKYRSHIGVLSITTNGTIIPNKDIMKKCLEYDVWFRISNYSEQIPQMVSRYERLKEELEQNNITYILEKPEHLWRDYGFEYVDNGLEEIKLISVLDNCKTICREIRNNRFYYCVSARAVAENTGRNVGEEDYLDFEKLDDKYYITEILEYNLGYSEKGYLDMCRYCHGAEAYKYPIPAAEQVGG